MTVDCLLKIAITIQPISVMDCLHCKKNVRKITDKRPAANFPVLPVFLRVVNLKREICSLTEVIYGTLSVNYSRVVNLTREIRSFTEFIYGTLSVNCLRVVNLTRKICSFTEIIYGTLSVIFLETYGIGRKITDIWSAIKLRTYDRQQIFRNFSVNYLRKIIRKF